MKINYDITGEKRKSLVTAISKELNAPVNYLGAPTFAYEVGGYRIDKNGMLEGKDGFGLVADLCGLHSFKAISEEYDSPDPDEADNLVIEMPRLFFTDAALENLKRLVESKSTLIKNALGATELPLEVLDETIRFPWFSGGTDAEAVKAYIHFVAALCEMAKSQHRISALDKPVENEKYAFRCFLLRLGFIGDEFKSERKILLSKLTGSSAFKEPKSEVLDNE